MNGDTMNDTRHDEDWCGNFADHPPHGGCTGWPTLQVQESIATADRLAAADRENAELRGEVERLHELVRANSHAVLTFERERNSARAQLAAAQAQLAEAVKFHTAEYRDRKAAEARLEAVRAQADEWRGTHWANDLHERSAGFADDIAAALSAAPQPEPEVEQR